jgi:hypothetical protein
MAAPEANYQAYLESVFPNTTWELERLTGGLVNATSRATRTSGTCVYNSLIIKHARPYIECAGPEWGFSTERQVAQRLFVIDSCADILLIDGRSCRAQPVV